MTFVPLVEFPMLGKEVVLSEAHSGGKLSGMVMDVVAGEEWT